MADALLECGGGPQPFHRRWFEQQIAGERRSVPFHICDPVADQADTVFDTVFDTTVFADPDFRSVADQ